MHKKLQPNNKKIHSDFYGDSVYIYSKEFIVSIGREEPKYRCSISGLCCRELCTKLVISL